MAESWCEGVGVAVCPSLDGHLVMVAESVVNVVEWCAEGTLLGVVPPTCSELRFVLEDLPVCSTSSCVELSLTFESAV